jgi:cytochrome c2
LQGADIGMGQSCMKHLRWIVTAAALLVVAASPALAQQPTREGDPAAGRAFALETCTPCHVVSSKQLAPRRFATAPEFQAIANTKAMTPSALHAFLSSPHPTMPNLILSRQEEKDVIAYILSLRR